MLRPQLAVHRSERSACWIASAVRIFERSRRFDRDVPGGLRRDRSELDQGAEIRSVDVLERVSGVKFDIDRLREHLRKSVRAEDDLVRVLQSAKCKPSPIDAYFGGIYYIGPIFGAFRGTDDAIEYYGFLRREVEERVAEGSA